MELASERAPVTLDDDEWACYEASGLNRFVAPACFRRLAVAGEFRDEPAGRVLKEENDPRADRADFATAFETTTTPRVAAPPRAPRGCSADASQHRVIRQLRRETPSIRCGANSTPALKKSSKTDFFSLRRCPDFLIVRSGSVLLSAHGRPVGGGVLGPGGLVGIPDLVAAGDVVLGDDVGTAEAAADGEAAAPRGTSSSTRLRAQAGERGARVLVWTARAFRAAVDAEKDPKVQAQLVMYRRRRRNLLHEVRFGRFLRGWTAGVVLAVGLDGLSAR